MKQSNPVLISVLGGIVIVVVLIMIAFGVLPGGREDRQQQVTLEFWGIDDPSFWTGNDFADGLRDALPHIMVNYQRFDEATYETTLLDRIAAGTGPDIFVLKNSWIERHRDKIFPLPQERLGLTHRDFRARFPDGIGAQMVTAEGAIIGAPLYLDSLVLFYNKDIFNIAGIALPPATWDEVISTSQKLTTLTSIGDVIKSGIALGTSKNVEHAFEIVSALILQGGDQIIDPVQRTVALSDAAAAAFVFYASFADPTKKNVSWSSRMPNSIEAFAEGKTAMMIGFASDIQRIAARNPHLNLGIVPFPQQKNTTAPLTYASYFFPTVSKLSRHPYEAWQFLTYMSLGTGAELYAKGVQRPAARRDLIGRGAPTDELEAFYRQSLIARSWRIPSEASAERLFGDAIDAVGARSSDFQRVMLTLRQQLQLTIPKK